MTRRFTLSEAQNACKKPAGGLKKHKRVVLFAPLARERRSALSFSLSCLGFLHSSKERVTIRSSSRQNPRERRQNFKRRLSTTHKRTFFILDLRFHVIDGIRRLHFQGDGFARLGFHENLHLLLRLVLIYV